jgi:hypothetical protein
VLQQQQMSSTLTIGLADKLLAWLKAMFQRTGLPVGQRREHAKAAKGNQQFLNLAGQINRPPDGSSRKGFSRR